jgi:sugar phosphate isomerase/epimerase
MDRKTIAAQLYTVRNYIKTEPDIENTLKKVKEIGYNAVQVSGMGPIEPERLKSICDKLDLAICCTHIPYGRLKNDTEAVIREHKLWNCEYIGLGSMPNEYRGSREGFLAFVKESSEIAKRIQDAGLQFAYHNHNFEFEKFDGITGMEILLNETDPKAFGFIIDTYWVQAGGANPVEWIRKVAGRMGVVHLKDMAIINSQQAFAEIGQGNLDWASIIKECRDTGVNWYAVEQDICLRDPFESLKISLEYLMNFI